MIAIWVNRTACYLFINLQVSPTKLFNHTWWLCSANISLILPTLMLYSSWPIQIWSSISRHQLYCQTETFLDCLNTKVYTKSKHLFLMTWIILNIPITYVPVSFNFTIVFISNSEATSCCMILLLSVKRFHFNGVYS